MVAVLELPTALRREPTVLGPVRHRIIREDDVPWMASLALRRYPGNYDIEAAEMWVRNIVLKQPMVFYPTRTDHAFMITLVSLLPWLPAEPEATVVMICAEENAIWDCVRLARASLNWAIKRNCARWAFNSDTKYDIGPIADRLGLVTRSPRYMVNIR